VGFGAAVVVVGFGFGAAVVGFGATVARGFEVVAFGAGFQVAVARFWTGFGAWVFLGATWGAFGAWGTWMTCRRAFLGAGFATTFAGAGFEAAGLGVVEGLGVTVGVGLAERVTAGAATGFTGSSPWTRAAVAPPPRRLRAARAAAIRVFTMGILSRVRGGGLTG
jgi:hypothetical protein